MDEAKQARFVRYYFETRETFDDYAHARERLRVYNALPYLDLSGKDAILRELLGGCGENVRVEAPFTCDFGKNLFLGDNVFLNYNALILDGAPIRIGDNTIIAPNVQICAACHPIETGLRVGSEILGCDAKPITIGKNCWFGVGVTVAPGVTIGDNVVIGAGSVVVKDISSNVVAAGVPCRVLRDNK